MRIKILKDGISRQSRRHSYLEPVEAHFWPNPLAPVKWPAQDVIHNVYANYTYIDLIKARVMSWIGSNHVSPATNNQQGMPRCLSSPEARV